MPVLVAPAMSTTFPTFTSVFGSDEVTIMKEEHNEGVPEKMQSDLLLPMTHNFTQPRAPFAIPSALQHRGSVASLMSASTASSPTTANSIFDSPTITESTPASSPESATSMKPLNSFDAIMHNPQDENQLISNHPFRPLQITMIPPIRSESPSNKNVKNLALNIDAVTMSRPATSDGTSSFHPFSAPSSPLKEPLKSARRKPTNLTIRTPGMQYASLGKVGLEVPPTPSSRPSLQHFQSSPSLVSMASPGSISSSGLCLPLPAYPHDHSRGTSESSFSSQSMNGLLPGLQEVEEAETQERGYPNGPVLIYDCGVYLYLEPTREEASRFDTVINVAKEIKNPFLNHNVSNPTVVSLWRNDGGRAAVIEPQTAISEISFKSAFEWPQHRDDGTPTTPTQQVVESSEKQPEYLHIPWDHNSEILEDLYPLCQIIDDRTGRGKKVLIHCQLGVSRSASLVIAYGLFKGYQQDFHSMYMAVKERSQWVGPNMSLIYQLTDFRSRVAKGEYTTNTRDQMEVWLKARTSHTSSMQPTSSTAAAETRPLIPILQKSSGPQQSAAQVLALQADRVLPPVPLFSMTERPLNDVSMGNATSEAVNTRDSVNVPSANKVFSHVAISRPLPLRQQSRFEVANTLPRTQKQQVAIPMLSVKYPAPQMDLAYHDVPETPSIFSPRATEFMASPFGITSAGDLEVNKWKSVITSKDSPPSMQRQSLVSILPHSEDPRSPHRFGEPGELMRHIDDFL